jgi:glycosyltransferase involved in cell wall biosynthesis
VGASRARRRRLSQDPHPERFDLGGAETVRPDIGRLLPVFVLDRYEGLEARLLQDTTPALAEVAEGLQSEYPDELADLVSFPTGDAKALSLKLAQPLELPEDARAELRFRARRAAERRWSWQGVASRLLEPFN